MIIKKKTEKRNRIALSSSFAKQILSIDMLFPAACFPLYVTACMRANTHSHSDRQTHGRDLWNGRIGAARRVRYSIDISSVLSTHSTCTHNIEDLTWFSHRICVRVSTHRPESYAHILEFSWSSTFDRWSCVLFFTWSFDRCLYKSASVYSTP